MIGIVLVQVMRLGQKISVTERRAVAAAEIAPGLTRRICSHSNRMRSAHGAAW